MHHTRDKTFCISVTDLVFSSPNSIFFLDRIHPKIISVESLVRIRKQTKAFNDFLFTAKYTLLASFSFGVAPTRLDRSRGCHVFKYNNNSDPSPISTQRTSSTLRHCYYISVQHVKFGIIGSINLVRKHTYYT